MLKNSFQRAQERRAAQRATQPAPQVHSAQEMCDDFGNGFLAILSETPACDVVRVMNTNAGCAFVLGGMAETGCLTDEVIRLYGIV
jgi:hypothetical protein